MITRKGQKESAIVFSSRKLGEKRGCESQAGPVPPSALQHPFSPLPSPPSNIPHTTSHPTIPSIKSRRMSFFSRKKSVSRLHHLPLPLSFPHLSFSLSLLFISYRRSTRPRSRPSPHNPLATPTCKSRCSLFSIHRRLNCLSPHLPPANPLRTYRAVSTNHQHPFALTRTYPPPTRPLPPFSLHSLPNICHRNNKRPPPNRNHSLHNNSRNGLSTHGLHGV